MAQTPTTKAQVQAYRFVLKRMESALVRKDAVMLHDPMRTHLRAALVGLILAALIAAGFTVFGLIKPKSALEKDGIVIGKQSGAFFVFDKDPQARLIPVTNLASARLILFRLGSSGPDNLEPRFVDDSALANINRTPVAGIPGAPLDIPNAKERVEPKWSVCDTTIPDPRKPELQRELEPEITTTAVIGYGEIGRPLRDDETLLVRASSGEHYLVYAGKQARIDLGKSEIRRAFNLEGATPRVISTGLLNAIPSVDDLRSPRIPGLGQPSRLAGKQIGEVFQVTRPGGLVQYYVALRDGIQEVPKSLADLIRFTPGNPGGERIDEVRPAEINVPEVENGLDVEIADFPAEIATPLKLADSKVACLYWQFDRERNVQNTSVSVTDVLQVSGAPDPVALAQADGTGDRLDQVLSPAGKGAAVRGVVLEGQRTDTGSIWLITDQGVKFGVPNVEIAAALGLGQSFDPAPQAIVNILPTGPALDPEEAIRTFDTIDTGEQGSRLPQPEGQGG